MDGGANCGSTTVVSNASLVTGHGHVQNNVIWLLVNCFYAAEHRFSSICISMALTHLSLQFGRELPQ